MKKYLWIAAFFMTNLCFAQPDTDLPKSSTDNNLMIQLVDSKLANVNNKLTAVEQNNKADIADLKARTDEKLADKFKQLDDRAGTIDWWLSILGIILAVLGILMPFGAFWLNRRIDKNIKDSQTILERETKQAVEQIENKLKEADKLLTEMTVFHRNAERSVSEIQDLANKANLGNLTPEDSQKLKNDSNDLKNIPENQLTANDWFIRGINAQNNKEYYEAIAYYNSAIRLNPNDATYYSSRGYVKGELEQYKEALKDYDKAIALYPNFALSYNNRGHAKNALKQYEEALRDYDMAIALDPNFAMCYSNRGGVKSELEQYEEGIKDFDEAIKLDPNNATYYFNRGLAQSKLKRYEEALGDHNEAIKLNPNDAIYYSSRGVVKMKLDNYIEALSDCDKAIELDAKNVSAHFNKACAYALMKNKTEALNWLEEALQLAYPVSDVHKDEDWENYLDDVDFKNLIAKYNKQ